MHGVFTQGRPLAVGVPECSSEPEEVIWLNKRANSLCPEQGIFILLMLLLKLYIIILAGKKIVSTDGNDEGSMQGRLQLVGCLICLNERTQTEA